jgi:hypothetical protein
MQRFEVMSPVTHANHLLGWVRLSLDPQESEARINELAQRAWASPFWRLCSAPSPSTSSHGCSFTG